jgi:hypothetical protein
MTLIYHIINKNPFYSCLCKQLTQWFFVHYCIQFLSFSSTHSDLIFCYMWIFYYFSIDSRKIFKKWKFVCPTEKTIKKSLHENTTVAVLKTMNLV